MPLGYLCLVLHAHLPFVRHPEYEDFLEEDWLYEAITETYIPLLEVFEGLERDGVDWRLTMSVTPTLAAMLSDPLLQYRYVRHLDNLIALAGKEIERTRFEPEFHPLAQMYHQRFTALPRGFRQPVRQQPAARLQALLRHGQAGANHLRRDARLFAADDLQRERPARPDRDRLPGVRAPLRPPAAGHLAAGVRLQRRASRNCWKTPAFATSSPTRTASSSPSRGRASASTRRILCPSSSVACLARDTESSKQVWSAIEGYPGDYNYRDFYRDVGFDLDYEYLKPHLHKTGIRSLLGIKYYKITGRTDHKQPYNPKAALEKAAEHAGNFMFNREKQVEWLSGSMDGRPALIVAPYDAELFGHWWFEGPDWINFLLRKMHFDQQTVKTITVPEYLDRHPRIQVAQPTLSSWGYKGYCEVWLEGSNDWIYRHLHEGADRMVELARANPDPPPLRRRALNQAARELLLAQSSDWAFIIKTGTMVEYARERTRVHVNNFNHLYETIKRNDIDESWLSEIERRHNLFPDIDYRVYA